MNFETHFLRLVLWLFLPCYGVLLALLYHTELNLYLKLLVFSFITLCSAFVYFLLKSKLTEQFMQLSNIIEALNQGDYTLRIKGATKNSAHSQLVNEINQLADTLTNERFHFKESQLLLAKLLKQIDVAIFATNNQGIFTQANPAALRLLNIKEATLNKYGLAQLGLSDLISAQSNSVINLSSSQGGRWHLFKDEFREQGEQHTLYILSDLEVLLSKEEQQAWKNLVRVLSHEVNNSLSPIVSISATLKKLAQQSDASTDLQEDLVDGLTLIGERANRLHSFIDAYRRATQLPTPRLAPTDIEELVVKISALLPYPITVSGVFPRKSLLVDASQIEQCLINLLKNAQEAAPNQEILLVGELAAGFCHLKVMDNGHGIQNRDNLFVPLYTTKPQGTGLGLVLCKQIALAHQGKLSLENRSEKGCVATLSLPI